MVVSPLRVLLIDDDDVDYLIVRDLLDEIGRALFTLDWIDNYSQAAAAIAHSAHDVYLIDNRVGLQTGIDLVRSAVAKGCQAPLIVLTGQDGRDIDIAAMRAGAADYLVKGQLSAPLLDRSIRYAINRFQTLDALRISQEQLKQTNIELSTRVDELHQRTEQLMLVNEMNAMLQACFTGDEAYAVMTRWLRRIFPDASGALAVIRAPNQPADAMVAWGQPLGMTCFGRNACWALRRGRSHLVLNTRQDLGCMHIDSSRFASSLCVPITALGAALGLLYLARPEVNSLPDATVQLAQMVAHQIEQALTNVRLHEVLRCGIASQELH